MRMALIAIFVIGSVGACTLPKLSQPTSSVIKTCATGYSPSAPVIHLSVSDNGRSVTARLCTSLSISLLGQPPGQWATVQSSDEATLAIVPLPLAPPPPGGTFEIYLAERTGSAVLSSARCQTDGSACPVTRWKVTVTVLP